MNSVGSSVFWLVTMMPFDSALSTQGFRAASPGCPITAIPAGLVAIAALNWLTIVSGSQFDQTYWTFAPRSAAACFAPL